MFSFGLGGHKFGFGKHAQVDDYQFGGGAGLVLMIEPILKCIETLQAERTYDEIIYMTPDGKTFDQSDANALSLKKNMIMTVRQKLFLFNNFVVSVPSCIQNDRQHILMSIDAYMDT